MYPIQFSSLYINWPVSYHRSLDKWQHGKFTAGRSTDGSFQLVVLWLLTSQTHRTNLYIVLHLFCVSRGLLNLYVSEIHIRAPDCKIFDN